MPEEGLTRQIDYIVSFWELELECVRTCIQYHVVEDNDTGSDDSPTQWTDPEVYLVELAYSIYWSSSINILKSSLERGLEEELRRKIKNKKTKGKT